MKTQMKITISMLAFFWIAFSSAQAEVRIGVKAGVNLAKAVFNTDDLKTDNLTGFQAGPMLEISGISGLGIDAAVLYSQQGMKIRNMLYEEKVSALDVPVNLKLKIALIDLFKVYLTAGPYASFILDDNKLTLDNVKLQWGEKKFGVGLNFGAGVELVEHLQVGVNYQWALNDDYSKFSFADIIGHTKDVNANTHICSITAAFFF